MNGESLDRLERLFRVAQMQPLEEREAFLDAACADDPTLHQELRDLLHADQEAEKVAFLEEPAGHWGPRRPEQEIRFCTAPDGIRIAFSTVGTGPPLVKAANWLSHLDFDWGSPVWRHWLHGLSQHHMLVRYDARGCGLSDWEAKDYSVDVWTRDLETVVDALKLERFPLLGISQGGAVAITYAVRHPERVSHLILYGAFARGGAHRPRNREQAQLDEMLLTMVHLGWGQDNPAFRQVFTTMFMPDATVEQMRWFNDLARITTSPANAARIMAAFETIDVSELARQVDVPTLIVHAREDGKVPFEEGRHLAALIPGARFVPLEGKNHILLENEPSWPRFLEELRRFVGVDAARVSTYRTPEAGFDADSVSSAPGLRARVSAALQGRSVGHYTILEKLGAGGMGVVYKARDVRLERMVALKTLPVDLSFDEDAKRRFMQEAKAASALDHPNICTIHEIGEYEGQLFLAMPCYEGETLREKIARGPLPLDEAVEYAAQIAEGLAAAHEAGIIHRDVKPANVMVTRRGLVKLLDFGIAKVANSNLTRSGALLGTMAYMSPEQMGRGPVDHRADIWSLGVVLYEMIAGARPFSGEYEAALLYAVQYEEPAYLTSLRPDVPEALARIVKKALEKDPELRYQRAGEPLRALRRLKTSIGGAAAQSNPEVDRKSSMYAGIRGRKNAPEADRRRPISEKRTAIVVLPFENMGPSEHAYFAAGVTAEITSRLAAVSTLGVISRRSALHYGNTQMPTKQIGRELSVDYVLEGSVRWAPGIGNTGRVRIACNLIRVADEISLWTGTYDRDLDDIFKVQSEIAREVVGQLGMTLREPEREAVDERPTDSLEAYQAFLRGRFCAARPDYSAENWIAAVESYRRSVELDPEFAPAHAELSIAHSFLYHLGHDRSEERGAKSAQAAERAVDLAPEAPESHLALGYYYYRVRRDYSRALEEFAIAGRTSPGDSEVWEAQAYVARRQGYWDEALTHFKNAFELSPRDGQLAVHLALTCAYARHYREAIDYCDQTIALAPDQPFAYYHKAWTYWSWKGTTEEARAALEVMPVRTAEGWYHWTWFWQEVFEGKCHDALRRLIAMPEDWIKTWLVACPTSLLRAQVHDLLEEPDEAREAYDAARTLLEAAVRRSPDDPRLRASLGVAYAGNGRRDEALREGRRAVDLLPVSKDAYFGTSYVTDCALINTMVGEYDAALKALETLLAIPSMMAVPLLRLDPRWKPLRSHPGFQRLQKAEGEN